MGVVSSDESDGEEDEEIKGKSRKELKETLSEIDEK